MKALLIIAHGSRRNEANEEILQLTQYLNESDQYFDLIQCGFLEMASPDIPQSIANLADTGTEEIVVLPYFLASGWHVERDIPEILEQARQQHPHIKISQIPHIGSTEGMKRLLLMQIQQVSFQTS